MLSRVRFPRLNLIPTCLCVAGLLRGASFDDRVEQLFRPPLGEAMALSPDGHRVAYTTRDGRELAIVILNLDSPEPSRTVKVHPDRDGAGAPDERPPELRFLRWATPTRLVYAPAIRVVPLPPVTDKNGRLSPNPDGPTVLSPIMIADIHGRERGTLIDASHFMETSVDAVRTLADLLRTPKELAALRKEPVRWRMPYLDVLGFLPNDREQLILQTHGGYNMPMQHLVDTRTGTVRQFGGGWPAPPGEPQIFDWFRLKVVGERKPGLRPTTAWRDEELARVQRELESKFPRRAVEILDWTEIRERVLFRVTGGSDPGRIFVLQRREDLVLEALHCAPWLSAAKLNATRWFEFASTDGAHLGGYVTWPTKPRLNPPPLLVVLPSGFPGRAQPAFDPEAQILADLGFIVARLNHRGVAGIRAADLTVLRTAVDRVSVDDVQAAVEWIATRHPDRPFDRNRVATLGRGFGGYLAIRALQLRPEIFRCAIAIDAPVELRAWLQRKEVPVSTANVAPDIPAALLVQDGAEWKNFSVLDQAASLTNPVLLLVEPARNPVIDGSTEALRAKLTDLGRTAEYFALDPGFGAAWPKSRANVYRKIEEFLNRQLDGSAENIDRAQEAK